jgi:hypothetical protein
MVAIQIHTTDANEAVEPWLQFGSKLLTLMRQSNRGCKGVQLVHMANVDEAIEPWLR